jgi:hypothetical protein
VSQLANGLPHAGSGIFGPASDLGRLGVKGNHAARIIDKRSLDVGPPQVDADKQRARQVSLREQQPG